MTEHVLKSWEQQGLFEAINNGSKTHDLRIMDRLYAVGDTILHREYDWELKRYTGRACRTVITYITADAPGHVRCAFSPFVVDRKYGILSITKIANA